MRSVLRLHPVPAFLGGIGAIAALRDDAFEAHITGDTEKIPADFALLVLGDEYAGDAALEQACQVGFARRKRQLPLVFAVAREHVEGIELRPLVVPARAPRCEVRDALGAEHDRPPSFGTRRLRGIGKKGAR